MPRPAISRSATAADTGPSGSGDHDQAEASGARSAGGDDPTADAEAPIYTWNPGATTETFPAVPRDQD